MDQSSTRVHATHTLPSGLEKIHETANKQSTHTQYSTLALHYTTRLALLEKEHESADRGWRVHRRRRGWCDAGASGGCKGHLKERRTTHSCTSCPCHHSGSFAVLRRSARGRACLPCRQRKGCIPAIASLFTARLTKPVKAAQVRALSEPLPQAQGFIVDTIISVNSKNHSDEAMVSGSAASLPL